MKKNYVFLLGLSSCFVWTSSQAQTCTPTPDCGSLGYIQTDVDCAGVESVKCPFDTSKLFCPEKCELGSILYSDKSCSKKVKPGKTPIAIVFDVNNRLAVALDQAELMWSPNGIMDDVIALIGCKDYDTVLECNTNGKDNTNKIVDHYGRGSNYAAGYCVNYSPAGTNEGDWFLPSMKQLSALYNRKSLVNESLALLGRPAMKDYVYWSSAEQSYYGPNDSAWGLNMYEGGPFNDPKVNFFHTAPVLSY